MVLNRQVAPVKSCFTGSAAPTFYRAGKHANRLFKKSLSSRAFKNFKCKARKKFKVVA